MSRFNLFDQIRVRRPKRSTFDLSYDNKFSFNMGNLVPFYHTEVLPGDKFRINSEVFFRFAPMLAPIMHEVDCYVHYFFVPNRLLWSNWEKFITGGESGTEDILVASIFKDSGAPIGKNGDLGDFLGYGNFLRTFNSANHNLNRLPLAAYHLIYNEYYRDQNVDEPFDIEKDVDEVRLDDGYQKRWITLHNRRWRKDYFTSALPWAQRGADVKLPLGTGLKDSSVLFDMNGFANGNITDPNASQSLYVTTSSENLPSGTFLIERENKFLRLGQINPDGQLTKSSNGAITAKIADDSLNGNITINDLRRTSALQSWLERNARAGARYVEQIFSHFGIKSSDARLQRPEYLGGGKTIVKVSEVLQQNNSSESDTPLGTMAGRAIAVGNSNNVSYFAEEHGYIMGIMSVIPKASYFQGTHRSLLRQDKFDFYYPEFAHLGEQAILNCELFESSNMQQRERTFGYTPRYSEYKFRSDEIHGDFKDTLNYWHLARHFDEQPNLNSTFLSCDEIKDGLNRIFAVDDGNHIWCETYNHVVASRLMPEFGTPMLM